MTCKEALKKCPQLIVVDKLKQLGRDKYKQASDQLFDAVKSFCDKSMTIEKTSMDDFYIDLTDKCEQYIKDKFTFDRVFLQNLDIVVEGRARQYKFGQNSKLIRSYWSEAAVYVADLCDHIANKTGFICSAGISVNKALARIGSRLNKPKRITIIESNGGMARILDRIPIQWISGLGGRTGELVKSRLKVSTLGDLRRFRRRHLITAFDRSFFEGQSLGAFLFDICRGIDDKPVLHKPDFSSLSVSFRSRLGMTSKCVK